MSSLTYSKLNASSATARLGVCTALALIGLVGLGGAVWSTAASPPSPMPQRGIAFTYVARMKQLPQGASQVRVWIPLAKSRDGQEVLQRRVRSPLPYTVTQDPDYGNEMLYATFTPPLQVPLEITIDYLVRLTSIDTSLAADPAELQRSLAPHRLVIMDDEVRARTQQATAGRTTLIERARGIYDDVIRRMAYDKTVPGWGRGDTRRACLLGKGNCTDFHSLFISMARADRIPARFKIGFLLPPDSSSGTIPGYHCWAEFYSRHDGWVPVDASEAWKHPEHKDAYFGLHAADRILLTVGRDLQLVPQQAGEPVNIFIYPYVEVDGRAFESVETQCSYTEQSTKEGRT